VDNYLSVNKDQWRTPSFCYIWIIIHDSPI
jgi:hypothetical protein